MYDYFLLFSCCLYFFFSQRYNIKSPLSRVWWEKYLIGFKNRRRILLLATDFYPACARYSLGVVPMTFLNTLLKWWGYLKPSSYAISLIVLLLSTNSSFTFPLWSVGYIPVRTFRFPFYQISKIIGRKVHLLSTILYGGQTDLGGFVRIEILLKYLFEFG